MIKKKKKNSIILKVKPHSDPDPDPRSDLTPGSRFRRPAGEQTEAQLKKKNKNKKNLVNQDKANPVHLQKQLQNIGLLLPGQRFSVTQEVIWHLFKIKSMNTVVEDRWTAESALFFLTPRNKRAKDVRTEPSRRKRLTRAEEEVDDVTLRNEYCWHLVVKQLKCFCGERRTAREWSRTEFSDLDRYQAKGHHS